MEQWTALGRGLGVARKAHTAERAQFLFQTEDRQSRGYISLVQFVRLMALLSCSVRVLSDSEIDDERRVFCSGEEADPQLSIWNLFRRHFKRDKQPMQLSSDGDVQETASNSGMSER